MQVEGCTARLKMKRQHHEVSHYGRNMGSVAAYFDLDGTLLDASSEKTLTASLLYRRPWRLFVGLPAWLIRFLIGLIRRQSVYDAARNRGHFTLAKWDILSAYSQRLVDEKLQHRIPREAKERLDWHRSQGHRLVLVTATVAPMAEAMSECLGMDAVYGCGPAVRKGLISGSEKHWSVPRRKGKVPVVEQDAAKNEHDLELCWAYGNTFADSFFMEKCGNPIAVNPEGTLKKLATERDWPIFSWRV